MIDIMSYNFVLKKAGKKFTLKKYNQLNYFNYVSKHKPADKGESKNNKDNFLKSQIRARQNVFDIISCNINNVPDYYGNIQMPKFLTLTFKENITDSKEANLEFTNFNKRLSYHLYSVNKNVLKYICIPEFQKRGAIHFHVLYFNMPYIDFKVIENIWGNGFIFIESVKDNIEDYAKYVAKYINKENSKGESNYDIYLEKDMLNQKRYFCSRGLKRPVVLKLAINNDTYEMILSYLKNFHVDNYTYENEFIGIVEENTYEIKDLKTISILGKTMKNIIRDMHDIYKRKLDINFDKLNEYHILTKYFYPVDENIKSIFIGGTI